MVLNLGSNGDRDSMPLGWLLEITNWFLSSQRIGVKLRFMPGIRNKFKLNVTLK